MLADKDRIFTNIYGLFDQSLAGAMRLQTGELASTSYAFDVKPRWPLNLL